VRPSASSFNILDDNWGTCVILDGCRSDIFESVIERQEISDRQESFTTKTSIGSTTIEWLNRTFGDSHGEIVYVAGNPMVNREKPNAFHELIDSWRKGYDPETSVISPETVTEDALDARDKYKDKRLIVHYMQPHYPFIGYPELNHANYDFEDVGLDSQGGDERVRSVWDALEFGLVDKSNCLEGYKSNLTSVMKHVNTLVKNIEDRIVITSDHGNMIGEYNWPIPISTYGHPPNLRHKSLVRVPWVSISGENRDIIKGSISETPGQDEKIQERLKNLGYS